MSKAGRTDYLPMPRKLNIPLWDSELGIIFPLRTGVVFALRVGGTHAEEMQIEGIFVPLPSDWSSFRLNRSIHDVKEPYQPARA